MKVSKSTMGLALRRLGFPDLCAYLEANPGVSYEEAGAELGVVPLAVVIAQLDDAARFGRCEWAARDHLVRTLRHELKDGWGVAELWEDARDRALSSWVGRVAAHPECAERGLSYDELIKIARRVALLDVEEVGKGWLPSDVGDPIFERLWWEK